MMSGTTPREPVYIIGGCHPWSRQVFHERIARYPGQWVFVDRPKELTLKRVEAVAPRYLFFLHWSWTVPAEIVRAYECVGFHMTDLPYGRGGSPLQHLILQGHRRTTLSAFRLTEQLDAGGVYFKQDLSLRGSAQEIYVRASRLAAGMIRRLIEHPSSPRPQEGRVVRFRRRVPMQSRIPAAPDVQGLYDFIRMLDAEGYPRAFLEHRGYRYEFSAARRQGGCVRASVAIASLKPVTR